MTPDQPAAAMGRRMPLGIALVALSSAARAVWALWNVASLAQYIVRGELQISGIVAFSFLDGIIWAVLAIGVWQAVKSSRIATMVWCGVGIALSGYGLLSTP